MQGHRSPTSGPGRSSVRRPPLAALALALALWACGGPDPAPDASWPSGALLSARRDGLAELLDQLSRLEGTPLARTARELGRALPDCPQLEARAPDGAAGLREALRCAQEEGPLAGLHRHRGPADLALALPLGEGPRLLVSARLEGQGGRVALHWPRAAAPGGAAAWLPGSDAAGPARLGGHDRLLHARVRSDDLDLAALAPEGSQADDLFRLRSQLLSKALLDGTWELAVYAPAPGEPMPRIAAALGVRAAGPARAAAERFLDDVEASWSLRRSTLSIGGREAVCLPRLNLLPLLAPCLLASDEALLLGWNADSLRHALSGGPAPTLASASDAAPARLEIDFARLREADRSLAALHGDDAAPVARWPWRRLVAHGRRSGDDVHLDVEIEGSDS